MPVAHDFLYFRPEKIEEALELLGKYGLGAKVLAGGTDLTVQIKEDVVKPDVVIDIKHLKELEKLEFAGGKLHIGALVTFTELMESDVIKEHFPLIAEASLTVASVGVRNRATMAGNICSAVPSLDSGPALLVYDAEVIVKSSGGERRVPIAEWFTGPKKTAIKEGEFVTGIEMKKPEGKYAGVYVKLGRYAGEDLAQAGVGILASDKHDYKIAFCAVGPVPIRCPEIESFINGKPMTDALAEEAAAMVAGQISPITDIRSSKEYRIHMMGVMLKRGLKAAVARLNGEHIEHSKILGG